MIRSGWLSGAATLAAFAWLSSSVATRAEDYKLQSGDKLEFAILGIDAVRSVIVVEPDGKVRLPIGGQYDAAGRSIEAVHDDIVAALKKSAFPAGADASGNTIWSPVYAESIVVRVSEYRPIYVAGDVLTPGEQPFRFGTTIRQAVAIAGGFSKYRAKRDLTVELAGIEDEYRSILERLVKAELRKVRLQAEIDGADRPDFSSVSAGGIDEASLQAFRQREDEQFRSRVAEREKERVSISGAIESAGQRSTLLQQSKVNLERETRAYEDEVARVAILLKKGLTEVNRLNEAQRSVFLVATRSLETSAEVARIESELVELRRSLEEVDSKSRLENLDAIQEAEASISDTTAQLTAARSKMQLAGFPIPDGEVASEARIRIFRSAGAETTEMSAGEDVALQPGDLVDIRMNSATDRESAGTGSARPGDVAAADVAKP